MTKWLSEQPLQIAERRGESKGKGDIRCYIKEEEKETEGLALKHVKYHI